MPAVDGPPGKIRGKLYLNVDDLSAAAPYGGVYLGASRNHVFRRSLVAPEVRAMEWGGQVATSIRQHEVCTFAVALREWVNEAIALLEYGAQDGNANSDNKGVRSYTAGQGSVMPAYTLLLVPEKTTIHRAIILMAAQVHPEATEEARHGQSADWSLPYVFRGVPDENGSVCYEHLLSDMPVLQGPPV